MKHFLDQQESPEDLDRPLCAEELSKLARMLVSDATPDECMNISELDGFLTALVIGPGWPDPDLWLPVVWGRRNELRFAPDEAAVCGQSIGRLMRDIYHAFQVSPPRFAPIIELVTEDGGVVTTAEDWCSGFMKGVSLNAADWEPLLADQNHGISLLPMITLGTETGLKAIENAKDPGAEYDKVVGLLHCAVTFVHSYWRSRWSARGDRIIPGINPRFLRPGRNAPCPCGSGRKFKRCCANQTSA